MTRIFLISLILLLCSCENWRRGKQIALWNRRIAETHGERYVILNGIIGYRFGANEEQWLSEEEEKQRMDVSLADVWAAEMYLREQLPAVDTVQSFPSPQVHQKLSKYCRQYVGYINSKGEKILWINAVNTNKPLDRLIVVHDGGNFYWQIKVNLTTKKIYDLHINGEA